MNLKNYEVNEKVIDFMLEPLSTSILYEPEFSHPDPPAIAKVEYVPSFFTETCSAHTSSLLEFIMDRFTNLVLRDTPLMDIRSV